MELDSDEEIAVDDAMELDGEEENAGMAVCAVMKGIIVNRSAMTYAQSNVVFVEWLLESECRLNVLETWYLLRVEGLSPSKCRSLTKDMMLVMDPHKDNCPLSLNLVTFELFLQYLVTKKKKGGGDLSAQSYDGCHSALMHMFCRSKYTCTDHFSENIGDFICTMRRKVCLFLKTHNV